MKRFGILVLVLALALPMTLAAPQPRGRGGYGAGYGFDDQGMGPGNRIGFLIRQLDLTDQQKADAKKILEAERSVMEPLRTQLRENREALQKATENGQFNEATVTSLAQKQGDLMAQMIVSRHRIQSQIWQILTPEQRDKATQLREKAAERGSRWMGRHGAGPQQ